MQTLLHMALGNAVVAAAMALLLLPAARWLKRPALTHALSLLVLLKLVTPPLVNVPMAWAPAPGPAPQAVIPPQSLPPVPEMSQTVAVLVQAAPEVAAPPPALAVSPPEPSPMVPILRSAIDTWVAAAWVGSSALYAALVLLRIARLRQAVRRATVPGEDLTQEVSRLARQMGLAAAPEVRFVSGVAPPMLLALFAKPCVLVPAALWSRLDASKRQTLLLHELAHLRRRDHWVRYLELAATCAYWWHPAAWWARSALREAEEQCCDAWVIWAMPAARRTYMTTLLDAVDFISESVRPNSLAAPVLASGMGQFQHLQRRLTMVRERSVQRRLSGGGLVAVVLSAIALPLGPRLLRADDAPPTPPASDRQPPAVDEQPAAGPDGANRDPRANQRQPAPSTDSTGATGSTRSTSSPQARETPATSAEAPTATYGRSGMSQVESLDAQLKAARRQIEALEQELAATKAASPVPVATRVASTAAKPQTTARIVVVEPVAAAAANPPAPESKIIVQYGNGKLEAIAVPSRKTIWTNNIGPIGALESVAGKIIVRDANGKVFEIAVGDGRVLAETPAAGLTGNVGVTTGVAPPPFAIAVPQPGGPGVGVPSAPTATEQRLDAIERKLNALIEAVDRRAKLDADRAQAERARDFAKDPNQWQDGKARSDFIPPRDSAPDAPTPPDAVRRGRNWATPAAPSPYVPRRESAPGAPVAPTEATPSVTPPRRESPPSDDAAPPQPESTPAER